jgi:hypothetical protein
MMSFDRARVDSLRLAMGASLEELHAIRNPDPAAADVMRALKGACRTIEDWLPRLHDILDSTAMTSCTRSPLGVVDVAQARKYAVTSKQGREVIDDPLAVQDPPAPQHRTMEEVIAAIEAGDLQPMTAPLDANGRAGAPYEALAFAPSAPPQELGRLDLTSNAAKFADFWSDGLPVEWRHNETLVVTRMENVRITKSVHRLVAFDRENGPEPIEALTTVATVSGYMVTAVVEEDGGLSHEISEGGDPTAHFPLAEQESSAFSGAFYPDDVPVFAAMPEGPRYENPDTWTLTTSASPMKDDWGTWHA